mgnify:CR=1 FL=1
MLLLLDFNWMLLLRECSSLNGSPDAIPPSFSHRLDVWSCRGLIGECFSPPDGCFGRVGTWWAGGFLHRLDVLGVWVVGEWMFFSSCWVLWLWE